MHHYVVADLGHEGDPGRANRSAQPELCAIRAFFAPQPTEAGGVSGEQLVEGKPAFGF
jgi:hypothetical protein